ncbi:uncharacterized protein FOBCDRAFT_131489 [Fusarium oxysporum Fo47]|uniref:uncharacterized protein n=1 Tax=Fusarium oxysporum Fo47 TaxID=660027 RepID=UPI002869AE71|nr:uncharacterized protein FOBCDRAFT_131489 [Fusarium oxysporum Fo47]QKD53716.2 hypothetical protein FOBCDRAFT_131489 [Fusarium oxysporum Fo47]
MWHSCLSALGANPMGIGLAYFKHVCWNGIWPTLLGYIGFEGQKELPGLYFMIGPVVQFLVLPLRCHLGTLVFFSPLSQPLLQSSQSDSGLSSASPSTKSYLPTESMTDFTTNDKSFCAIRNLPQLLHGYSCNKLGTGVVSQYQQLLEQSLGLYSVSAISWVLLSLQSFRRRYQTQLPNFDYSANLGKPTFDNFRASTYAKECYQNTNSILCNSLSVSDLPRTNASVDCPFDKSICLGTPAFKMQTDMLDSHRYFGFNEKEKNRIRYKRETVCSPLVTDGSPSFIQYVRGREARTLGWEDDVLIKYLYGKLNGGRINQTLLYNTLSGNALTGYTTWSYYYPSQDAWRPLCNPTNAKCTRLVGSHGILESAMDHNLDFNRVQKVTIQRLALFLQSSTFYHTIFTRTQSFLRAQEKYQMMEYAAGSPRSDAVSVVKPWINSSDSDRDAAVWESMCDNQRTRDTQGTLNFSILGLSLLFGLGLYIILVSFVLELLLAWAQKKLGRGLYRAKRWERDGTLQQMRLLYEIQGAGVWKGTTEDFPRTTSGDLFEHDEEFSQARSV